MILFTTVFNVMVKNGNAICAFTIMPNHVHAILYYAGGKLSLNTLVGNGKQFIAYEVVQRLIKMGRTDILKILELGVQNNDRSRGKEHEVWIDAYDAKECRTEKFLCQKMHYMHNNPCHPRWNLSTEPQLYTHSFALFYMNGKTAEYR
jgi:REP element-mobilizing transposase RayT